MTASTPKGFRTEPDPAVTSASRVPTPPEFKALDRQAGWLVVNRWTYRPLRMLGGLILPSADVSGVQVTDEPTVGQGIKVVRPDDVGGDGAVLLIHGGGYVLGSNDETVGWAAKLARESGVPVFCPAYRLGPEDPFPAGLDDCHHAWTWLIEHASRFGVDPDKVVVGGISAGGGLAAGLVQRLHDEGGTQPSGQLLVCPMLDDTTATRHELDSPRHRVWSNANNRFGWTGYLGHAPGQPSPPYAVPAAREDLSGLPPAWVGVGTADLFLDEDREYARRLTEADVEVDFVEVDGGIHGFNMAEDSPLAEAFDAAAVEFVRRRTA